MNETIFVIGGCKSGKSRHALETADNFAGRKRVFIATCIPNDEEMKQRVVQHQKERSRNWDTVEAPVLLPDAIVEHSPSTSGRLSNAVDQQFVGGIRRCCSYSGADSKSD